MTTVSGDGVRRGDIPVDLLKRSSRVFGLAQVALNVGLMSACLWLTGCAGFVAYQEGQLDLARGQRESGLQKLKQASDQSPGTAEYRRAFFAEREAAMKGLLHRADVAVELGEFEAAKQALDEAMRLESTNERAVAFMRRLPLLQKQWSDLNAAQAMVKGGDVEGGIARVQAIVSENPNHQRATQMLRTLMRQHGERAGKDLGIYPRLKAAYRKPVSLTFNGASLQQVFEALKVASGLNYVLDREVRTDQRVTLSVAGKPVEDVLRMLMTIHQLERRILDEDTLLIFPATPAKQAEYREMVVRTFYLSHADPNKVAALLKTMVRVKDVAVDDKLNTVIVRDTGDVIRLAEKLIATQDIADPEVMLELEVLEVSANRLIDMGVSWPSSVSATVVGSAGIAGRLTLEELRNRNSGMVRLQTSDPLIAAQLRSQKGNANLLANPRVRVRNRQSAKILIGERVPVFTSIATANVGTSESVNYLDVGLKLDIEPTISMDDEVSMKLALEVSNIIETVTRASGTQAYRLGTRNTSTTLRVRDGETNILAGLIQRDERRSNTGVPGLNEVPLISKLFGSAQDTDSKTEIVLLVTPHIVRNVEAPGIGFQEFLVGTDGPTSGVGTQAGVSGASTPPPSAAASNAPIGLPRTTTFPVSPTPSGATSFGTPASLPQAPAAGTPAPAALTPPPIVPATPNRP